MGIGLRIPLVLLLAVMASGCGEKRVDASTTESMNESLAAIRESLPDDKRSEFEEAYKALVMSSVGNVFVAAADPVATMQKTKDKVNGKTAADILAEGGALVAEQKKKAAVQAASESAEIKSRIADLEKKQADNKIAAEKLKKFEISRSRFKIAKTDFMDEMVIELTVKNETGLPVSHAYFEGVLSSPGRSVPWVKAPLNYKIPGGIEPGEEVTWSLSPNMFGEWSKAPKDRDDAVLTMTTVRIDGADEKPIYDASEPDTAVSVELERLNKRLSELAPSVEK